jgi:cation:H+ antiporter
MATAIAAARRSAPDLVVGNVLGSNLFNSLAVAGTAGIVGPAVLVDIGAVELWFMTGAVVLAGVFARTGKLVRWEAVVLLMVFAAFTAVSY